MIDIEPADDVIFTAQPMVLLQSRLNRFIRLRLLSLVDECRKAVDMAQERLLEDGYGRHHTDLRLDCFIRNAEPSAYRPCGGVERVRVWVDTMILVHQ